MQASVRHRAITAPSTISDGANWRKLSAPAFDKARSVAEANRDRLIAITELWLLGRAEPVPKESVTLSIRWALSWANKQFSLHRARGVPVASGLEPKEIARLISAAYWSTYTSADVAPKCWLMAKDGRLTKNGMRYDLPGAGD